MVVTSYLLYTIAEAFLDIQEQGDFYRVLGISPLAEERTIKSRFRRLAAQYHPDKTGGWGTDFMQLKLAHDTILDPARRFVYDRFGPDSVGWGNGNWEMSEQALLYMGLEREAIQYAVGLVGMIMFFFWWSRWGRYVSVFSQMKREIMLTPFSQWRFYTFHALFVLELLLITQQSLTVHLLPVTRLMNIPLLLPFQMISLARQVFVTLHMFISQIGPSQEQEQAAKTEPLSRKALQDLVQLAQTAEAMDLESIRLMQLGLAPFQGDRKSSGLLRKSMKDNIVLGIARNNPEVLQAVSGAAERRQAEKQYYGRLDQVG